MDKPRHVFTVDLEDWYQGLEIDMNQWGRFLPRIENGLDVLLDLCDEAGVHATFFVLGKQAEKTPEVIKRVASRGHEIACHGYSHRFIYQQTPEQFQVEVRRAKKVLEEITGDPVVGFRAPFFSITEKSIWALDVLLEEGFRYDSSLFPVLNYRYGLANAARVPGNIKTPGGASMFEIPLSTVRFPHPDLPGINLPISGGGYFRLYPYKVTWALAKLLEKQGTGLVFYVHPWEFDSEHPRLRMPRRIAQFTHYLNLEAMSSRTRQLMADFQFVSIREAYGDKFAAGA